LQGRERSGILQHFTIPAMRERSNFIMAQENAFNNNLTPEQKEIAVKSAMATHLDAFFRAADTEMESVTYYEEPDAFRFKFKSDKSFLLSATKRDTVSFLCELFRELEKWVYLHGNPEYAATKHLLGQVSERPE
jgi:hypothetical protein